MTNVIIYDNICLGEGVNIYQLEFYKTKTGEIPVEEFLKSLDSKLRAKAFNDIELLRNLGNTLREPDIKPVKGKKNKGLWELRIKFSNDIARIFYFTYHNGKYILLYGFIKKSFKTPIRAIERARNYMNDYIRRNSSE